MWAQGQRLRFMVRDREGAMQDMRDHAVELKRRSLQARPPPVHPVMGWRGIFRVQDLGCADATAVGIRGMARSRQDSCQRVYLADLRI